MDKSKESVSVTQVEMESKKVPTLQSENSLIKRNVEDNNPSLSISSNSILMSIIDPIVQQVQIGNDEDDDDGGDFSNDDFAFDTSRLKFNNRPSGLQNNDEATGMTRRCACNLSQCASTNYMCKSERRITINDVDGTISESVAGCFVEELDSAILESTSQNQHRSSIGLTEANGKVTSARRGCIEMLSREKFKMCSDRIGSPVHCCFDEDMCNYPKTFYPPQIRSAINQQNRISFDADNAAMTTNIDHQVWLRAALLTIPVFGIIILIILIIFARRMLKNDSKENRISRMNRRNYSKSCRNHSNSNSSHVNQISNNVPSNVRPLVKPICLEPEYRLQNESEIERT